MGKCSGKEPEFRTKQNEERTARPIYSNLVTPDYWLPTPVFNSRILSTTGGCE